MSKQKSQTIHIKGGPALNNYFAEWMVKEYGPEDALERTAGPMREAVKAVIAAAHNEVQDKPMPGQQEE